MYQINIRRAALKELQALPGNAVSRISAAIDALATEPRPNGCKKLQGSESLWRIRVGNYRIIYAIQDVILLVDVQAIGHRKDIYD